MKKITQSSLLVLLFSVIAVSGFAQTSGSTLNNNGESIPLTTSVPFLRIVPDARAGAMGDVGLATTPDANAIFHNPAKLAFNTKPYGVSLSYVPWLRSLVNDIYLAHATGYVKLGAKSNQAIGASIRYFSLGQIQFTDQQGASLGDFKPNEFAADVSYSRILAEGFSAAISMRFIYSNLAGGQVVQGISIKPGIAAAADLGFYYNKDIKMKKMKSNIGVGLNFSNLGSKITYTSSAERDFIPMNMGIGTRYTLDIDDYNQINIAVDFNKLLVPTPIPQYQTDGNGNPIADPNNPGGFLENPDYDADDNGVADYREKSVPGAIFSSFGDAPGGFKEELKEFTVGVGAEYWYDQLFAVRAGYFYESPDKGKRRFLSVGVGLRYSVFGIDFAYLVPTSSERSPLDNTLRFTLLFNFDKAKPKQEAVPTTVEPPVNN
jgi:hypothetical protein